MSDAVDKFLAEIRAAPKFIAACELEPKWLDELDQIERVLDKLFRSDLAEAVQACDRIVGIVEDKSIPLKQRLLAMNDVLREVVRHDA
jgi:hypothetical protein